MDTVQNPGMSILQRVLVRATLWRIQCLWVFLHSPRWETSMTCLGRGHCLSSCCWDGTSWYWHHDYTDCTSGFGGKDADVLELDAMSNGLLIQMITLVWSVKDVWYWRPRNVWQSIWMCSGLHLTNWTHDWNIHTSVLYSTLYILPCMVPSASNVAVSGLQYYPCSSPLLPVHA